MDRLRNLNDLFRHELRNLYDTELQIIEALPEMIKRAEHEELQSSFESLLDESEQQRDRLREIASNRDFEIKGEKSEAARGLIREGERMVSADAESAVKDAGLIATCQRIQHYQIACYGAACQYARQLNDADALEKLKRSIQEEKDADSTLTRIAKATVNEEAEVTYG